MTWACCMGLLSNDNVYSAPNANEAHKFVVVVVFVSPPRMWPRHYLYDIRRNSPKANTNTYR